MLSEALLSSAAFPSVCRRARPPAALTAKPWVRSISVPRWPLGSVSPSIDRMEVSRAAPVAMAMPCEQSLAPKAAALQPRSAMAAAVAAVGGWQLALAKISVIGAVGLAVRHFFDGVNARFKFPLDMAIVAPTARQRQRAVDSVSAIACLICFALLM